VAQAVAQDRARSRVLGSFSDFVSGPEVDTKLECRMA